jgi:hypothetical protein
MIVLLDRTIFSAAAAAPDHLKLLGLFADVGPHAVLILPRAEQAKELWLASLDSLAREEVEGLLAASVFKSHEMPRATATLHVTSTPDPASARQVTLETARDLIRRPLEVLLEHEDNDWSFLRCLATPRFREQLDEAEREGWLRKRHAGGLGQLMKIVDGWIKAAKGTPEALERRRSWVLFDRDADSQDCSKPHPSARRVVELLDSQQGPSETKVVGHQLGRRSIESYLPSHALEIWGTRGEGRDRLQRRQLVEALKSIRQERPEAAWQLSMKAGLRKDISKPCKDGLKKHLKKPRGQGSERARLRPDQLAKIVPDAALDPLFRGLSDEMRGALLLGFGDDIAGLFDEKGVVREADFDDEYSRGPKGQLSRESLLESLVQRI